MTKNKTILYAVILAFTFTAPFLFPAYGTQLATLWLMIIVALTWDMTGGQMGYNSLGNIFFYGTGMYVAALISIGQVYDIGDYTNAAGGGIYEFTDAQYFGGLFLGIFGAGIFCSITAVIIGSLTFGLRGPYFAIGTLGVAIAAGELVSNWEWVGGGQGIALPVYPGDLACSQNGFTAHDLVPRSMRFATTRKKRMRWVSIRCAINCSPGRWRHFLSAWPAAYRPFN